MGLEFDKICVWKEPFPFNPLIAVLASLDASVKQPFEIHINRQSLVCCAVV